MKHKIKLILLCGIFALLFTACSENVDVVSVPEETAEETTELTTLSSEEVAAIESQAAGNTKETKAKDTSSAPTEGVKPVDPEALPENFGTAVYVGHRDNDSERYLLFYGDGTGNYIEQEDGAVVGFTYEMNGREAAVFHFGEPTANNNTRVLWLDEASVRLNWEDGTSEILTRLPNNPHEEFKFYSNAYLRERALMLYEQLNGSRPDSAESMINKDGMIAIHLYDDISNHILTCDWYIVDRYTGKGTNRIAEEIDLSQTTAVPTDAAQPSESQPVEEQPPAEEQPVEEPPAEEQPPAEGQPGEEEPPAEEQPIP